MLTALLSGTLIADPKERQGSNGRQFVTAAIRVPIEDGEPIIANVIVFVQSAQNALLALRKGDGLAVTGRAKLSSWNAQDGTERHGLSVVGEQILTAYHVKKRRRAASGEEPLD